MDGYGLTLFNDTGKLPQSRLPQALNTGGQDVVKAGRGEQVTSHHPQARAVSIAQDISSHLGRGTYADLPSDRFRFWYLVSTYNVRRLQSVYRDVSIHLSKLNLKSLYLNNK